MEINKCPNCGASIDEKSTKCPYCGTQFAHKEQSKSNILDAIKNAFNSQPAESKDNSNIIGPRPTLNVAICVLLIFFCWPLAIVYAVDVIQKQKIWDDKNK